MNRYDMEEIRRVDELISAIPNYMSLPIRGFANPNYHCLNMDERFYDVVYNKTSLLSKFLLSKEAVTSAIAFLNLELAFAKILFHNLGRLNYYCTRHFYGVQPVYGNRGFTTTKDNRLCSFTSEVHNPISPWEYIFYNHPVHAVADGEVVDVVNDMEDKLNMKGIHPSYYMNMKTENFLGNQIKIRHNKFVNTVYSGLKKNSFTKKIGDTVKRGEVIGRVGMSSSFPEPQLLFNIETVGVKLPLLGHHRLPLRNIVGKWDTHMEAPIIRETDPMLENDDFLFFNTYDWGKIKYNMTTSNISTVCLIKQYPDIKVE